MECSSWQKKAIIAVHYFLLPDFSYFHVSFASTAVPVGRSFTSAPSSKSEQFVFIEIESVEIEYIGPSDGEIGLGPRAAAPMLPCLLAHRVFSNTSFKY